MALELFAQQVAHFSPLFTVPGFIRSERDEQIGKCFNILDSAAFEWGHDEPIYRPISLHHGVVQVACGSEHLAILTSSGQVFTCGGNDCFQCGLGKDSVPYIEEPTLVPTLFDVNVKSVVCGPNQTGAIVGGDTFYTWGLDSSVLDRVAAPSLFRHWSKVGEGKSVLQLHFGPQHTAMIVSTEDKETEVWTWGMATNGLLGNGKKQSKHRTPTKIFEVESHVVQLAGSDTHMVALDTHGKVYAWGENENGCLRVGSSDEIVTSPALVKDLESAVIRQISCGRYFTVALAEGSPPQVFSWGTNDHGQLGQGYQSEPNDTAPPANFIPFFNEGFDEDQEICLVLCGEHHACALSKDRLAYMWGSGANYCINPASDLDCIHPAPLAAHVTTVGLGSGVTFAIFGEIELMMAVPPFQGESKGPSPLTLPDLRVSAVKTHSVEIHRNSRVTQDQKEPVRKIGSEIQHRSPSVSSPKDSPPKLQLQGQSQQSSPLVKGRPISPRRMVKGKKPGPPRQGPSTPQGEQKKEGEEQNAANSSLALPPRPMMRGTSTQAFVLPKRSKVPSQRPPALPALPAAISSNSSDEKKVQLPAKFEKRETSNVSLIAVPKAVMNTKADLPLTICVVSGLGIPKSSQPYVVLSQDPNSWVGSPYKTHPTSSPFAWNSTFDLSITTEKPFWYLIIEERKKGNEARVIAQFVLEVFLLTDIKKNESLSLTLCEENVSLNITVRPDGWNPHSLITPDTSDKIIPKRMKELIQNSQEHGEIVLDLKPLDDGSVKVTVVRCRNLDSKDMNGFSDPYVILIFNEKKKKTKVVRKSLDPEFGESFLFNCRVALVKTLRIEVYDWDRVGKDEFIGMNHVELGNAERVDGVTLPLLSKNAIISNLSFESSQKGGSGLRGSKGGSAIGKLVVPSSIVGEGGPSSPRKLSPRKTMSPHRKASSPTKRATSPPESASRKFSSPMLPFKK